MLVSKTHKFIFIHVPKTAGSSITAALAPYSLQPEKTTIRRILSKLPLRENIDKAYFRQHATALQIQRKFPKEFSEYYKFAVVRNPYDYAVSYFQFLKSGNRRGTDPATRNWQFIDFLKYAEARPQTRSFCQYQMVTGRSGEVILDRLLYFENLENDLNSILPDIGINAVMMGHQNKSKREHYSQYYSKKEIEKVDNIFKKDFQILGYKNISIDQMGNHFQNLQHENGKHSDENINIERPV